MAATEEDEEDEDEREKVAAEQQESETETTGAVGAGSGGGILSELMLNIPPIPEVPDDTEQNVLTYFDIREVHPLQINMDKDFSTVSIYLSVCLSICDCLSVYLPVCLSTCMSPSN